MACFTRLASQHAIFSFRSSETICALAWSRLGGNCRVRRFNSEWKLCKKWNDRNKRALNSFFVWLVIELIPYWDKKWCHERNDNSKITISKCFDSFLIKIDYSLSISCWSGERKINISCFFERCMTIFSANQKILIKLKISPCLSRNKYKKLFQHHTTEK